MMHDVLDGRINPAISTSSDLLEMIRILLMVPVADQERAMAVRHAFQERPVVACVRGAKGQSVILKLYDFKVRCVD